MSKGRKRMAPWLYAWFGMTRHERMTLSAILLILLIGITARHFYLKKQVPTDYDPPQPMETTNAPIGTAGAQR
ncbi:MAG: hypothetical protein PHP44_02025 [Kiritimatiellae bacterium]|nr:hypothetical protein [Kiritimatiellia bacterium]MDD4734865.1 hypothetical protein [Kiritimatiellia bacterium]